MRGLPCCSEAEANSFLWGCLQDGRLELKQGMSVDHEAVLNNTPLPVCACVISPCLCASVLLCLWSCTGVCGCSLRSEGGVLCPAWVCGSGGRVQAWRAAVPGDLHNGVAASRHRLPRPGGFESCVSQSARCSPRQQPQRCFALWPGQTDHFFFFLFATLCVTLNCLNNLYLSYFSSSTVLWKIWLTPCSGLCREESKPSCLAFTTSSVKQTLPLKVCYLFRLFFVSSDAVGSCVTSVENIGCTIFFLLLTFQPRPQGSNTI